MKNKTLANRLDELEAKSGNQNLSHAIRIAGKPFDADTKATVCHVLHFVDPFKRKLQLVDSKDET